MFELITNELYSRRAGTIWIATLSLLLFLGVNDAWGASPTRGAARTRSASMKPVATETAVEVSTGAMNPQTSGQPEHLHEDDPPPPEGEPPAAAGVPCSAGQASGFPCHDMNLLALVPRSVLGAGDSEIVNDLWGWVDERTGREYALVGRAAGVSFVDVTDPTKPVMVGVLPTRTFPSSWRDLKTIDHYVVVVADGSPGHGMQIFDLHQLQGASPGQVFAPTADYFGLGLGFNQGELLGSSHNVGVNQESGFAYIVGTNTCAGGLHMVDMRQPLQPRYAGCFSEDGYSHDVQCVIYRGPDADQVGAEVCFAANEDTVTIVNVSDKAQPRMISRTAYSGSAYTHQAWLTENHQYLLVNDELDELRSGHGTRTRIFDVSNLAAPRLTGSYTSHTSSTDHNLYVKGEYVYEANYTSGLRVLSLHDIDQGHLEEVAFFDTYPANDAPGFEGAWSVYPFLPSGNILVSSIGEGLFILRPQFAGHDH